MSELKKCKLVLGNGFDLYCGLNTSYDDFFKVRNKLYSDMETYKKRKHDENFRMDFGSNHIPSIKKTDGLTFWDIIFYFSFDKADGKNWCDIEKVILDFFLKVGNSNSKFDSVYKNVKDRRNDFNCNDTRLEYSYAYIIEEESLNKKSEKEFAEALLNELSKFEKEFGKYVYKEFSAKLETAYKTKLNLFIKNIKSKWTITSIDTFNYTPLENAYGQDFSYDKHIINHINGDYNNPIFGIDSSKMNAELPSYIFTKTYRRMTSDFYEGLDIKYILSNDFDDLVIFGHSLNEQDYSYYFPLFDYMDLMNIKSHKGIVFYYYIYKDDKKDEIKNTNYQNLIAMLNAYEKCKTDRTNEYRLVDALSTQGRLKFIEIKDAEPAEIDLNINTNNYERRI